MAFSDSTFQVCLGNRKAAIETEASPGEAAGAMSRLAQLLSDHMHMLSTAEPEAMLAVFHGLIVPEMTKVQST